MDSTIKQISAALIAGQVLVGMGFSFGLHSITLIQVPEDEDRFMNDDQLNWTIAVTALALMTGSCLAMLAAPVMGARRLLMLTQLIHAVASLAAGLGKHFGWVLFGRFLTSVTIGMSEGTARGYMSEIVPPNRRALFTAVLNAMLYGSQAASIGVARHVHWRTMFIIAGFLPSVVCLVGLFFIPNSPKWLLSHGHPEEEALHAIRFFHGKGVDAEAEVLNTKNSLKETLVDGVSLPMHKLILQRETLRPLLLITVEMVVFIWSGGLGITFITPFILKTVQLPLDKYQSALISVALTTIFCLPASMVIERFGRLPLLRASGAISALGCAAIAAFFFLPEARQQTLGGLALAGAVLTQLSFACIIAPIALTYVNELLPNRTRTFCANITMGMMYMDLFIFLKTFPLLSASIGLGGVFVIHLVVGLLQVVFAMFCIPETKDLSLEQIQQLFQKDAASSGTSPHVRDAVAGKVGEDNFAVELK